MREWLRALAGVLWAGFMGTPRDPGLGWMILILGATGIASVLLGMLFWLLGYY